MFGKTRQGYYYTQKRALIQEQDTDEILTQVMLLRKYMPYIGTRKIYACIKPFLELRQINIGRDKFFDIMRDQGLLVRKRKQYTRTTNSYHRFHKYPNLIKELDINRKELVWVSDITYIKTKAGIYYLNLITDAYTKKIVGHEFAHTLEAKHCLTALKRAIKARTTTEYLIHHSDRGIQYCSQDYTSLLHANSIEISMTENGSPYENAIAERVNGILKTEFFNDTTCDSFEEMDIAVNTAIEIYNTKRPHMSCSMLTPEVAHDGVNILERLWKSYPHRKRNITNELDELSTLTNKEKK